MTYRPACNECEDIARQSLIIELKEMLRARGFWAPTSNVSSDIITALGLALNKSKEDANQND